MPLRALLLSDIHFSTVRDGERIEHADVRQELLTDLRGLTTRLGKSDRILVAGDVAFSGKRKEYELASTWLDTVADACGCDPNAVLVVPGNHDVDRERVKLATKMIHDRLRGASGPQAKKDIVALAQSNDGILTDKLAEYIAFASSYGCQFESAAKPHWIKRYDLSPEHSLTFAGLTTVQVCDDADTRGAMMLGAHQYTLVREAGCEVVAMMHHPLDWLKDQDDATQYLNTRARVLIYGHKHLQDIHKTTDVRGEERLIIASGAVTPDHAGEPYSYRYNVLDFDCKSDGALRHLLVRVHPRVWVPADTCFRADRNRLPDHGQDSATFELSCPQFAQPRPSPPAAPPDRAAERRQLGLRRLHQIFWRQLDWRTRLAVLVKADVLPNVQDVPAHHALAHLALRGAEESGRLAKVWDLLMKQLPADKREPNPF